MAMISINAPDTRFYISTAPEMPRITLQAVVQGIPTQVKPEFAWSFKLEYNDFIVLPGSRRRNVRPKAHAAMPNMTGNPVTVPLSTLMCGRLTVTVETTVGGAKLSATRNDILVGGTNPTAVDLTAVVVQAIVRKMIRRESCGNQFSDTALPPWTAFAVNRNWSSDNRRGVGLGQLTNPPPEDADIWNWRANALHLQQRFQQKRASAATLHKRVAASQRFTDEVKALNDWRAAEGQPPLPVRLPALDSDQQDLEGLRAYNGFGIKASGQYLDYIHEFEPAMTVLTSAKRKGPDGQPLKSPAMLDVDVGGNAKWTQISGAERQRRYGGSRSGDPDYVANVLSQQD